MSITKTINYNNPLNIGFISVQDACPSNQGYGSITLGNYTGGSRFNYPNDSYWAYTVDIIDSSGNSVANDWHVPDNVGHQNNVSVQSGQYILILTDASGCSIYDTVNVEDLIGSKHYISTTGSDAATGAYSDPLATIQEALDRSCDGDTIILFDGEYFENVELTNSYLPYVTIASEYIEDGLASHISNTIVNGMDEDPVFDISNHNSTTDTIVFVGFTITNGKSSNWYGGGGISMNYSNIALKHMQVSGNRSGHSGGGIGMDGGYLNLWNTVIENNIASGDGGGIRANHMYRIDGHGSTIIQNNKSNSNGGGISYGHSHWGSTNQDFYIRGFEIVNNSADGTGGLHVSNWGNNNGTLEIDNIKVVNNRSTSYGTGGAYISNNGEDAILSNVIISSNRSNSIGGLELNDVDINIVHATVYANGVVDGTSANDQIRLQNNSNVLFLNSAVGGQQNVGTSIAHTFYLDDYDTTCDLTISNSIVSGGINSIDNPYSSNIVGTPIGQALYLVNPQQGDYMLSAVSQGLGAGTSSYTGVTMPMIDIEGGLRPNPTGSDPDVGAVESPLDSATFGAAYEIRNNIACDPTYGRLKVIPLNGSGSYKYELDDLTGSATFTDQTNVSSYTYSSLYSGNYLVTITDLSSSDEFTDTVTISGKDSLTLNLVYNDIFCAGEANGAIAAIVSGGDGYYDYTWSTTSNSILPKSNKLNNLNPDEYYITVKDGDNCFAEDSVTLSTLHSLPLVAITGNIDKGGTTTQTTNPQVRACAGDIVTLDAGAGYVSYNWTTIDQLNSWSTQTLSASYEEGFYVTVIDSFGCTNTDTAEVFYVQSPAIFASNVNTNIGGTYQQVTSYIEGTNQSTGLNSEPKPYGANERFAKMQFIIPANELIAEGLTDQTAINSLGFEVDIASGSAVQNFKIKIKNTTSNQVGYTFESGLTQVYDFNVLTAGDGWNTHEFDQGFVWDGTKNLLVQVEYSNVAFTNGIDSYLIGHSTSYNSSSVTTNSSSSVANQTSANNVWSWRPNMKFGIDKVQATDTLRVCDFTMLNTTDDYDTYAWLVAGSSQGTQLRYSMSSPNEVVLKTVDAASSCTMYSDTVQVLLDTTPSVFVTSPVLAGCIGDSVIAAVDTVQSGLTYNWSNGVSDTLATFTESGSYYVYAVSPSGCEGVDTVDVSINIPPDVVIELNGRVLTSTDGNLVADNSSCDTTLILPYYSAVDTLSALNNSEWSTYSNNFLEWEYQQGWDSLQDYTGPNYDADSNYFGGFYQFDPASLTDQNKVGYLQLGCINLLGMTNPELSFEYHMVDVYADSANTSDQMGALALQLKAAGDADWNTIWQRSGTDTTYDWASKSVALDGYVNQTVQVRWKATAGVGGPRSEMGLDNILVSDSLAALSNVSGRITAETVCEGDSLYAQAVSNGTTSFGYLWSTGDTTSAISLQTTGWYAVSVMDEENCIVQTDSVFITVNPAPNNLLVVSDTTQYCAGTFDSLIIAATAGYDQYEWYFKQVSAGGYAIIDSVNAVTVDSIITGSNSYYVTITDSIGCKATSETVDLIQRDIPSLVMTSAPVLCNNDSTGQAMVQASGSGGFAFEWSNNQDSNVIDNITDGWYSVTVTDSFSCSTIDSVLVVEPSEVSLTAVDSSDVNCFGGNDGFATYTFTGGVGNYQYSWTDSSGAWSSDSLNLTNASAGMYFLNAADSNGCSVLDTVSIGEPPVLVLTIDSTSDLTCYQNADGYLSATVTGGFGSYNYYIDGVAAISLTIDSLDAGSHVVSVIDDNGCSDSASFTLTEPALLTATTNVSQYLGGIQVSCNGATDGSIDVFINGGTLPYSFLWTDGDTTEDRSNIGAGAYSMTVTDEQGCTVTMNEVITEPTLLVTASTVDSLDCYGASDGLINYTFSGATAPYITSWSSSTGSTVDSVLATFQVDMNGASINAGGIELITNSGFNYGMNVVSVLEDSIYRITIPVAVGTSIDYRFFNGSTPESVSSSCGVNIAGTFYRNVTINSDTTLVAVQFSSCTTVGSAYSGAMTGSGRTLTGLSAGSYSLSVSDVNGCATQMTDVLLQPDSISITATVYDASCPQTPDGFIDVTATGGSGSLMYNWSTTDTTEDLTAAYGYYTVTVTDAKGCMDSATFLIDAPFPYNDEELCVVTVDTTGVNLVVWEKTPSQRTADYIILRENAATQYVSVGNNTYLNMSTWADQNSNPAVQPYRYKLVLQDSCGNYSDTSDYHATIHLQASQGVAQNEVNLQWTAYEGKQVQTYYIYRWLSPINRVLVDSVSSNVYTYTDIYPVTTTITALLYEVGAKFVNGGCSPSTGKQSSYANSMSNVLDWGQDGGLPIGTEEWVDVVLGNDLDIYPNPTLGSLNLELKGAWEEQEDIQIKVTDMTGRILAYRITQGASTVRFDFEELPAGVYFLNIITGEGRTIVKRFERIN
ncbi:T9SS type A sorting domain-containing protein [Schleiferiaceae bacterium]|nr:T9SS type A sorting domain-containing protein [Schleiferiaceae bacterium]MDA9192458.1 T9SS type A sorting domain-containing protein [Schleiferiaceae bacterium]